MAGTYLNSFFESHQLAYAEKGYGFPESGQSVVNATNGKLIRLLVDDEPFDVRTGQLVQHERTLDFRAGTLRREVEWTSPAGQPVRITSTRLVCFRQRAVMAIRYEVEARRAPHPDRAAIRAARQRAAAPERRGSRRRGSDARPAAAGGSDRRRRTGEPDPPHAQERAADGRRLRPPVGGRRRGAHRAEPAGGPGPAHRPRRPGARTAADPDQAGRVRLVEGSVGGRPQRRGRRGADGRPGSGLGRSGRGATRLSGRLLVARGRGGRR